MDVKTYRAKNMQAALQLVAAELGPDASVLHTRVVHEGIFSWFGGGRRIEVTASSTVNVPSRIEQEEPEVEYAPAPAIASTTAAIPGADELSFQDRFRAYAQSEPGDINSLVEDLCHQGGKSPQSELPESLFHLFTDLIDAEVSEELARELVNKVKSSSSGGDLDDPVLMKARIARMIEDEIRTCGPIQTTPREPRLVSLVGPTGVGKTTTIAKLAANFHLREKRRVGLITVDTYRIAAVEQLRTYADIIDLPMEVVSTPKEMRGAVERLSHLDLVLMDTAGRSPRDEVRIQELRSMLTEAQPDEVHLVLSAVTSVQGLKKTVERFENVGVTSLLLTKLDEATGLGNLLPLMRSCSLPISYVTNGQNVPEDIEAAHCRKLARIVLGMEASY